MHEIQMLHPLKKKSEVAKLKEGRRAVFKGPPPPKKFCHLRTHPFSPHPQPPLVSQEDFVLTWQDEKKGSQIYFFFQTFPLLLFLDASYQISGNECSSFFRQIMHPTADSHMLGPRGGCSVQQVRNRGMTPPYRNRAGPRQHGPQHGPRSPPFRMGKDHRLIFGLIDWLAVSVCKKK